MKHPIWPIREPLKSPPLPLICYPQSLPQTIKGLDDSSHDHHAL